MTSEAHDDRTPDVPSSVTAADVEAFDQLYLAYAGSLCRFVYSYVRSWETAEDLVDEVFTQFWVSLQETRVIREPKTYLFTTARNRAISYLRHQQVEARHRERFVPPDRAESASRFWPSALERQLPDSDRELTDADLTAALQRAVDALPPRQRAVVLLKWQGRTSNEEIAQELGIASTTVSEHFRRALAQLRQTVPQLLAELSR